MEDKLRLIRVEKEESAPLAVVLGGKNLGVVLANKLRAAGLAVNHVHFPDEALPALVKPDYVFLFVTSSDPPSQLEILLKEIKSLSSRQNFKTILIEDNASSFVENLLAKNTAGLVFSKLTLQGQIKNEETADKIIYLAFSPSAAAAAKQTVLGKSAGRPKLSTQDILDKINTYTKEKKRKAPLRRPFSLVLGAVFFFALLPVLLIGWFSLSGARELLLAKDALLKSGPKAEVLAAAQRQALLAKSNFSFAKTLINFVSPVGSIFFGGLTRDYYELASLGENAAVLSVRLATIVPKSATLAKSLLPESPAVNLEKEASALSSEVNGLVAGIGVVEGELRALKSSFPLNILKVLGVTSEKKVLRYEASLRKARVLAEKTSRFLDVLPNIVAFQGQKTYLLVFQNSAELRPTGGFIGSFALVRFARGQLLEYKIYDIYTADGQLKGKITPPDEILHYLGQPSWFMRDANWSPDWPLTAQRLIWFLEKEMGIRADAVLGVNLGAAAKILSATGPLEVAGQDTPIDQNNFFERTEEASEINFFAGSTQKRDFLGSVAQAILDKIINDPKINYLKLGQVLAEGLTEKDILLYFSDPLIQKVISQNDWSASLTRGDCEMSLANCLLVVDANLGANKANAFVKRTWQIATVIDKSGQLDTTVTLNYQNTSPSDSWPGGRYKNYLRFLLPSGAKFLSLDDASGRQATVSSILTADVISRVPQDQFLVVSLPELSNSRRSATQSGFQSYGLLLEIPVPESATITLHYQPAYKLDLSKKKIDFNFRLLRQPGAGIDPVEFSLDFPAFLNFQDSPEDFAKPLVFNQRLVYNLDLSEDRQFTVRFER